ncbi:hypothetical protein NPIL_200021 [Nephila pilipes]|uniref:Uncharacterized protein n=1 Tax=Nephila pilipes TaxID=299642 RepID=A0A8X6MWY2_NEPPI|nr:hypothetical protein NPIL_200021 [Nephila pilipes]
MMPEELFVLNLMRCIMSHKSDLFFLICKCQGNENRASSKFRIALPPPAPYACPHLPVSSVDVPKCSKMEPSSRRQSNEFLQRFP